MLPAHKPDRRIERTRGAILAAFNDLVLTVGYDRISVRDIIERAGIGRSTFYEHFEDKDEVLRQSVTPVLAVLAATVADAPPPAELTVVVAHFKDNRRLLRAFFDGPPRRLLARYLAALIEERVTMMSDTVPLVPATMVAAQLAESQLGLVQSWLEDPARAGAAAVATALVVATRAAASALLEPSAQRACETRRPRAASIAAETAIRR
ncbi:MAG TPA: TetR/AcrR family transcriptional regulator [Candidatus Elarobacter sp.]|nr:TetR/AcrR family transcriptional regulator [Candidatus Elarobacter sp.]